jgi:hypothetical protein
VRPSTILPTLLTVVSGVATVVLAVLVGPGDEPGFVQVLRLGGLVTVGFGGALVITVTNRRRRDRLRAETEADPDTVFVEAHARDWSAAELQTWSAGLPVRFPCDLGFDRDGMTARTRRGGHRVLVATAREVLGFDVFDEPTPLGSTSRWGIAIHLAPRAAGPATLHLWLIDGQPNQDEYAMRRTIARIEAALGR